MTTQIRRLHKEGRCLHCERKMPKSLDYKSRSMAIARMDPAGYFCTLRCAAEFGVACATVYTEKK